MFLMAIWDKLHEYIFENFVTAWVKQKQFQTFKNYEDDLTPKLPETSMCLLVNHTKPTKLLTAGNYKPESGQLQNNTVNGVMLITIDYNRLHYYWANTQ